MDSPQVLPGLVTIIVPLFNREKFLRKTMASLLRQSYPKIQLILVDDGSTDRSYGIARSFEGPRVLLLRGRRHQGQARALNQGLPLARGEWITFFDNDDWMLPRSLEVRVDFLRRHPRALAVMGRVQRVIDERDRPLRPTHPVCRALRSSLRAARQMARGVGALLPELFVYGDCPLCPLSVTLFRRQAIERLGPMDERSVTWEDREYLTRLALHQPVPFLDAPVMRYRVHGGNSSFRLRGGRLFHPKAASFMKQLEVRYTELQKKR